MILNYFTVSRGLLTLLECKCDSYHTRKVAQYFIIDQPHRLPKDSTEVTITKVLIEEYPKHVYGIKAI